jgi:hypothetical protein
MEPEGSLSTSQEPVTCPYPENVEWDGKIIMND